jgi:hypothetical protein
MELKEDSQHSMQSRSDLFTGKNLIKYQLQFKKQQHIYIYSRKFEKYQLPIKQFFFFLTPQISIINPHTATLFFLL